MKLVSNGGRGVVLNELPLLLQARKLTQGMFKCRRRGDTFP